MTLALVTVCYNNYSVTDEFISSLSKQKDTDFILYLIDASTQKQNRAYPSFVRYFSEQNKGYAYGINVGLQQAIRDGNTQLVALNNDIDFKPDFISQIKKSLEENQKAIIGAKIYYYPGYEYHKDRYTKQDVGYVFWYAGGIIDWSQALTFHRGVNDVDHGQYDQKETTDFVTGCFMAFSATTYRTVGPWDESYFMYYEDSDWCERAKRKNIRLLYDPSIILLHKNAQSTDGVGSDLHVRYQEKNRLRFGLRYAPWRTKLHLILNYVRDMINYKLKS